MNPIVRLSGAISHPTKAAATVARATLGASVNVASAGFRLTSHALGWTAERVIGTGAEPSSPWVRDESDRDASVDSVLGVTAPAAAASAVAPTDPLGPRDASESRDTAPDVTSAAPTTTPKAPAKKAPAKKAPVKNAAAKKAAAKKAPSKKAAVLAPALGLSEAEVQHGPDDTGPEPLIDPGTAKAVASESAVLQKAADPDKG